MNDKYGKISFFYYSEEDKLFLNTYLETVYSEKQLTERQKGYVITAINGILQGERIEDITYEKVMTNYSVWGHNRCRRYGIHFLDYLCINKKINTEPLNRIHVFIKVLGESTKACNIDKLLYIFELDTKYINLYLANNDFIPKEQLSQIVLSQLEVKLFPNKSMFNYLNDKYEQIKYDKNYTSKTIQNNLFAFRTICYDILSYNQNDFNASDFMHFLEMHTSMPLLFTVLKYFVDCDLFQNTLIRDTIILIRSVEPMVTWRPTLDYIQAVIDSGKPLFWHKVGKSPLYFYNCKDNKKLQFLLQFTKINHKISGFHYFVAHFDDSLESPLSPLSFYTYLEQIKYFSSDLMSSKVKRSLMTIIHSFYTFCQTIENDLFTKDGYSSTLLVKNGVSQSIMSGYKVINHNLLDKVPSEDKWLLCYKEIENSDYVAVTKVDFTIIHNEIYRYWVKYYVWFYDIKMKRKIWSLSSLSLSLNYIQDLKMGNELSFFTTPNSNYDDINTKEVTALISYIRAKYENVDVQGTYIYGLKSLLEVISNSGLHRFEDGVFLELVHHKNFARNKGLPIPDGDLVMLSKKLSELAKENTVNHLFYLIFYIAIETELRPQQIFDLEIDCIKETAKKNEFIIISTSKTSHQEKIEQAATVYAKKCIDKVLELTSNFRAQNTNEGLNKILFIVPMNKKGTFGKVTHYAVNRYLNKVSKSIGLNNIYTLSSLRDTHMTKNEEYIIKKGLSDTQLKVLTGHKSTTTTISHYSKPTISEMLEAVYGVTIGNVDIKGQITANPNEDIAQNENLVSEKCGYCSSESCNCFNDLDCLLCKSFVTTTDRKVYFEERIKALDHKIQVAKYEHDVADIVAQKRLLIGYLNAIISLEEVLNANK